MIHYTEQARIATDEIIELVSNDEGLYRAARRADPDRSQSVANFAEFVTAALKSAPDTRHAYYVALDLSPRDYERIHWTDVVRHVHDD